MTLKSNITQGKAAGHDKGSTAFLNKIHNDVFGNIGDRVCIY